MLNCSLSWIICWSKSICHKCSRNKDFASLNWAKSFSLFICISQWKKSLYWKSISTFSINLRSFLTFSVSKKYQNSKITLLLNIIEAITMKSRYFCQIMGSVERNHKLASVKDWAKRSESPTEMLESLATIPTTCSKIPEEPLLIIKPLSPPSKTNFNPKIH